MIRIPIFQKKNFFFEKSLEIFVFSQPFFKKKVFFGRAQSWLELTTIGDVSYSSDIMRVLRSDWLILFWSACLSRLIRALIGWL